jgi:hypothetical protein
MLVAAGLRSSGHILQPHRGRLRCTKAAAPLPVQQPDSVHLHFRPKIA